MLKQLVWNKLQEFYYLVLQKNSERYHKLSQRYFRFEKFGVTIFYRMYSKLMVHINTHINSSLD